MKRELPQKLTNLTLKLIEKDLKRIKNFKMTEPDTLRQVDPPPGAFSLVLSRYFSALNSHRRFTEKTESEEREALKKLSLKQLKELAGVKE